MPTNHNLPSEYNIPYDPEQAAQPVTEWEHPRVPGISGRWGTEEALGYMEPTSDSPRTAPHGSHIFDPGDNFNDYFWNNFEEHFPWVHPDGRHGVNTISRGYVDHDQDEYPHQGLDQGYEDAIDSVMHHGGGY